MKVIPIMKEGAFFFCFNNFSPGSLLHCMYAYHGHQMSIIQILIALTYLKFVPDSYCPAYLAPKKQRKESRKYRF